MGFDLPPEQQVDCDCRPRLERPVLFEQSGWNSRVTACVRCGRVTLVEALIEEPHPHDVQCVGNRVVDTSPALAGWFDAWPRYALGVHAREPYVLLPAGLRLDSAAELAAVEEAFLLEQQALDRRARFDRVGYPAVGPPEALPWPLTPFEGVREGLQLSPDTPLDDLLLVLGRKSWARWVALPLLRARPEYPAVLEEWLGADEAERRAAALELVALERLGTPGVVARLGALVAAAPTDDNRLYALMNVCDTLGAAALPLVPTLRATAERIGDSDYYLRKRVEETQRRIEAAGA